MISIYLFIKEIIFNKRFDSILLIFKFQKAIYTYFMKKNNYKISIIYIYIYILLSFEKERMKF